MNDDELLARLKSADPALTGVAPPPDIDRLVEDTLNTDTALQSATTAAGIATASWGRRHLFGLAAAGLLVLGGGVAGGIMANSGDGNGHSASAKTVAPAGALRLTAEGGSGKCMVPGVDTLGKYPTLFEGTATSVKGSTATFHVDRWFKGGDAETVVLSSDTEVSETLTYTEGGHYIIGAEDGFVPMCAAIEATPEDIAKFRQAFGS
ncbi:hypothetical protein [Streptomyces sp. NRRL F-525]|uniref:hypothetical protein n=1 Tax=Streptomyces sp. NRRL F-525 TaxID=1463861 RepID=UPI000523FA38|nr:hypothetical protein [Streptomyces sp. NRRL F-525]